MAAVPYPAYGAEEKANGMERFDCWVGHALADPEGLP